jgi:hypothetical protein
MSKFPEGWDKERVGKVVAHYEGQTEDEAVAEDEMTAKTDYIVALLRELKKRKPIESYCAAQHHLVTLNEHGALTILVVIGDAGWLYTPTPDELTDDPAETAERLVKQFTPERICADESRIIGLK